MSTAENLLVIYGLVVLTYGFVLGVPLAGVRMKSPVASPHLVNTHIAALIQAPIHLGLAYALGAVSFDSGMAVVGALLVIAGSLATTLGGTANWLQGTGDQFAQKSLGFRLNSMSGIFAIPGALIITIGVVTKL